VGGKCRRLGRDKALERIGDKSLLERVLSTIRPLGDEIILVAASGFCLPSLPGYRVKKMFDIYSEKGPLGGIYTGLTASTTLYSLIVACDMPFLNQPLLRYMVGLSNGYDLVVPRMGKLVEPLHAVYSKGCLQAIEHLLKQGDLSVSSLFKLVRVRYVDAEEIGRFDPGHLSFLNINTEADLKKARELAGEHRK